MLPLTDPIDQIMIFSLYLKQDLFFQIMIERMIQKLEYLNKQSEILLTPIMVQNRREFGEFIKLVIAFRVELQKTKTSLERLKKRKGITGLVAQLQ